MISRFSKRAGLHAVRYLKSLLAASLLLGVIGSSLAAFEVTPAGAVAAPGVKYNGFSSYTKRTAAEAAATVAPSVFNVNTIIVTGTKGKTAYNLTSLTILATHEPPATFGTFALTKKTATQDYVTFTPHATITGTGILHIGFCKTKALYNKTTATCTTATITYRAGVEHDMSDQITLTIKALGGLDTEKETEVIHETPSIAKTVPTAVTQNTTFVATVAAAPAHIPKSEGSDTGVTITVNYAYKVLAIVQMPSTKTFSYVATSIAIMGGTKKTYKTVTAKYCTAAGTDCTATTAGKTPAGAHYKTRYPYVELKLATAVHVTGGTSFSIPSVRLKLKAIGAVGTVGKTYFTQFRLFISIHVHGGPATTKTYTVAFNGYPSTKAKTTKPPPYKTPTPISTTTIRAHVPKIKSITPPTGFLTGSYPVKITGTGTVFETECSHTPACSTKGKSLVTIVMVGTTPPIPAATYTVVSAKEIKITKMPKSLTAKTVKIKVTTSGGTGTATFTYKPSTPTITSVLNSNATATYKTKPTGPTTGTTVLDITGANLTGTSTVTFTGVAGTTITNTSATKITVKDPPHKAGAVSVKLTSTSGSVTKPAATKPFTYKTPKPVITTVANKTNATKPTGATTGTQQIVLTGKHFTTKETAGVHVTLVKFATKTYTTANFTLLGTTITLTDQVHKSGAYSVTAKSAGGTSLARTFTYVTPKPAITAVANKTNATKATGPVTGAQKIKITGTHFKTKGTAGVHITNVKFATKTFKTTTFTFTGTNAIILTDQAHAPGLVAETATNVSGSSTPVSLFTYTSKKPVITSISKKTTLTTTAGGTVTINGSGFVTPETASIKVTLVTCTVPATSITVLSTKITVVLPAHKAASVVCSVHLNNGTTVVSATSVTWSPIAPSVTFATPTHGLTTATTPITITGKHFSTTVTTNLKVTKVVFAGVTIPATTFTQTKTTVSLVASPHVAGPVAVVISVATGKATPSKTVFTYDTPTPVVTSVTNSTSTATYKTTSSGPTTGGTVVVIHGSHFVTKENPTIYVDSVGFGSTTVHVTKGEVTTTTITIETPAHKPGAVVVSVLDLAKYGTNTSSKPTGFTFLTPKPVITGIATPTHGTVTGSTPITIKGLHFSTPKTASVKVTKVGFGTATIATFTQTKTKISFTTLAHAKGSVSITITTTSTDGGGSVTKAAVFSFGPPAISVTSAVPPTGSVSGTYFVTLSGHNFITPSTPLTKVNHLTFGGTPALTVTVKSTTLIHAKVPGHAAGLVTVTASDLASSGSGKVFTYETALPSVTSALPVTGSVLGSYPVTITGKTFLTPKTPTVKVTKVLFGTVTIASFTQSNTTVTFTAPPHVAGLAGATITTTSPAGGGASVEKTVFTYVTPAPKVTKATPATGSSKGGKLVTISGAYFATPEAGTHKGIVTTVSIGGKKVTSFTVTATGKITAHTTKHAAGLVTVTVATKSVDGGGTTSHTAAYSYKSPLPTISSVAPATGSATGGTPVVIKGTFLCTPGNTQPIVTTVTFGGSKAGSIKVATACTSVTVKTTAHSAGAVTVFLTTQPAAGKTFGGGTAKSGTKYTFKTKPLSITRVSPPTGSVLGHTPVTITGSGFETGSTSLIHFVTFGGSGASSFNVTSKNTLQATTSHHAAGKVSVTIKNNAGTSATDPTSFSYIAPGPSVTTVKPTHGTAGSPTIVTIYGTNFETPGATSVTKIVTSVTFGGVGATTVTVTGPTTLTARPLRHGNGLVAVAVTTVPKAGTIYGGGTASKSTAFDYLTPSPKITSVADITNATKPSGPTTHSVTVVVSGTNFETPGNTTPITVKSLTFGGIPASTVTVTGPSTLVAKAPKHVAGLVSLGLQTPTWTITSGPLYSYDTPNPTISAVSPTKGSSGGNTSVTITGSGFETTGGAGTPKIVTTVSIGGKKVTSFTVTSPTTITIKTAKHVKGTYTVTVVTLPGAGTAYGGGTASDPSSYTFVTGTPVVTSLTPDSGPFTTTTSTVKISGTNFATPGSTSPSSIVTKVKFGITPSSTVTFVSANEIIVKAPTQAAAGFVTVTVTTSVGSGHKTLAFDYVKITQTITTITPATSFTTEEVPVTIKGTKFTRVTKVTFGNAPGTTLQVTSATQLKVSAPPHLAGKVTVTVTASTGSSGIDKTAFTYKTKPPTITSITPAISFTTGGTPVTITGSFFETPGGTPKPSIVTAVTFGGTRAALATVRVTGEGTLTAKIPPHVGGGVVVKVTTQPAAGGAFGGGTTSSASTFFSYITPKPVVTSVTKSSGPTTPPQTVTIHGSHFVTLQTSGVKVTNVSFGGTTASIVTVTSSTLMKATTPPHAAGQVTVSARDVGGTGTSTSNVYTFDTPKPTVTSVSSTHGYTTGNTFVTVKGTNFVTPVTSSVKVTKVTFTTRKSPSVSATSATVIRVEIPAHKAGSVPVSATLTTTFGGGTGTSAGNVFTYDTHPPLITSITPSSGKSSGRTEVKIKGTYFLTSQTPSVKVTKVTFGSITKTATINSVTKSTMTVTIPANTPGSVNVKAHNAGGTSATFVGFVYNATKPTVTTVKPTHGYTNASPTVHIKGARFETAKTHKSIVTEILFGTMPATFATIVVNGTTTLQVKVPPQGEGKYAVTVVTTAGRTTNKTTTAYRYITPTPTITTVSPDKGLTKGGTPVTINGSGFMTKGNNKSVVTQVTFGGATVTSFSVTATTTILVVTEAHAKGFVVVSVVTKTSQATSTSKAFDYVVPPVPTLSSISPTKGSSGGGTPVTIDGTNLTGATSVAIGGVTAKAIVVAVTGKSLTAVTKERKAQANVTVVVTTPGGSSTPLHYSYVTTEPTVTGVNPSSGSTKGSKSVTISGSHFTTPGAPATTIVTQITFGGIPVITFTVISTTSLLATYPGHGPGLVNVAVKTQSADGGGTGTKTAFTYVSPGLVATSLSVTEGTVGGSTPVVINGSNFITPGTGTSDVTTVTFGGTLAKIISVTTTTITVSTTKHITGPALVSVKVTSTVAAGSVTATIKTSFTYVTPKPTVTKVTPGHGPKKGTNTVTVIGTGFETPGTGQAIVKSVSFGTTNTVTPTFVTVTSPTTLTVKVPKGTGTVTVTVTTRPKAGKTFGGGVGPLAAAYKYGTGPAITNESPTTGSVTGRTTVTLTGSHFTGASVTIGGKTVTTLKVTATKITFRTPAGSKGLATVVVTTPTGSATTTFTYVALPPTLSGISQSSGSTGGGTKVTLIGHNLTGTTTVKFGTTPGTNLQVTGTSVTVTSPAHSAGPVTVVLTNPDGSAKQSFTFTEPTPSITSVSPTSGPTSGGTTVTITGTGFVTPGTGKAIVKQVLFGTTPATTLNVISATSITVKVPAHAVGSVSIEIKTTATNPVTKKTAYKYTTTNTVPGIPNDVLATPGNAEATLTWVVPSNGGAPITSFTVVPYKNGVAQTPIIFVVGKTKIVATARATDSVTLKSLVNSDTYKFTVSATNSVGKGLAATSNTVQPHSGFWLTTAKGAVANYGSAKYYGSEAGMHLNSPIEGITATANNKGYWLVATDGGIFTFGNAGFFGSLGSKHLKRPIKGMAVAPTDKGYWMVEENGEVYAFGKAKKYGTAVKKKPYEIISITTTTDGKGYWLTTVLGRVFHYGDAKGYGTLTGKHIKGPMVGFSPTRDNKGYWLITVLGNIYHFGDAKTYGKTASKHPKSFITGILASADGNGYWVAESNGTILSFGDAEKFKASKKLKSASVAMAPMSS